MISFSFYFYDLPSSFGHPTKTQRGLSASDGPNGRYAIYFHALAMSIAKDSVDETVAAILDVERGMLPMYELGGCGWTIRVTQQQVYIEHEDYDDLNNEELGTFPFSEFKWVLMAWWEFLLLPDLAAGTRYTFALPVDSRCQLDRPDRLLSPTEK